MVPIDDVRGQLKILKDQLEDLNVRQLLEVQQVITDLLLVRLDKVNDEKISSRRKSDLMTDTEFPLKDILNKKVKVEFDSDDDFLLTQFNQNDKELFANTQSYPIDKIPKKLDVNTNEALEDPEVLLLEQKIKLEDQSSPLKGSQILSDSQEASQLIIVGREKIYNKRRKKEKDSEIADNISSLEAKIEMESEINHKDYLDLNKNPFTQKPWILEDFKPNESLTANARGRTKVNRNLFLEHQNFDNQLTSTQFLRKFNSDFAANSTNRDENIFENLKDRSKSPPGFGRLDFPNTQERTDDKKKSQALIIQKTKYRFVMATRKDIPFREREFHFKNMKLNEAVNAGKITWAPNKLIIFSRGK